MSTIMKPTVWNGLWALVLVSSVAAAAGGKIPRLPDGKPDFSGIWETTSAADYGLEPHGNREDAPASAGIIEGDVIPYLPKALEERNRNFQHRQTDDPRLKGWTLGTPRGIYFREPFQIFQRPDDLKIIFQFGQSIRNIYTNASEHPDNANGWLLGDSRGKWDGDTLIVDVQDFTDKTWLDRIGDFHSPDLHVVERWKLLDPDTIAYRATLEDPQVFSRPWSIDVILYRHREKNFQLIEDYRFTLPFDQYYPPKPDNSKPAADGAPSGFTDPEAHR
jgi:hypothetical protein